MVGDWKSSMYVQIDFIHYRYLSEKCRKHDRLSKGGLGQHHRRLAAT